MYPLLASNPSHTNEQNYSFYFRPIQPRPEFLEPEARRYGCEPTKHYRILINGEAVTLEDGALVTPEMVMGEVKQS